MSSSRESRRISRMGSNSEHPDLVEEDQDPSRPSRKVRFEEPEKENEASESQQAEEAPPKQTTEEAPPKQTTETGINDSVLKQAQDDVVSGVLRALAQPRPLRTRVMVALVIANIISLICALVFAISWIETYRGGINIDLLLDSKRPTQLRLNMHMLCMLISLAVLMPISVNIGILLEFLPDTRKCLIDAIMRLVGLAVFVYGMVEVQGISSDEMPPQEDRTDRGIHAVCAYTATVVYIFCLVGILVNSVTKFREELSRTPLLGTLMKIVLNQHFLEDFSMLVDTLSAIAIVTGFTSYVTLLYNSANFDLLLVFNNRIGMPDEWTTYVTMLVFVILDYFTVACIVVYRHNLLYHNGIITYSMYKNHFDDIAMAIHTAESEEKILQEIELIESTSRLSRFRGRSSFQPSEFPEFKF